MEDYIFNKIKSEVWLHFKLQVTFKKVNKTGFSYWDYKKIDLFEEYLFYCNLNDIEPSRNVYNNLISYITDNLEVIGYKVEYNTDEETLYIRQ